jgi:glutamate--cysteine ligase
LSNDDYFALIRNFRRQAFVLLYLFGASPAVCSSFVDGRAHELQRLSEHTLYLPHATSLRMGRLGYQSDAQAALAVSYNSLENYAGSLHGALTRPHPPYERLGLRNLGGEYNQIATSLLQIENEFYGTIRPKRVIRPGERPLHALRERGVEYIEVRCMDLDPFVPVGIAAQTMRVLDVFLLHCLLGASPPDSPEEIARLAHNQHLTAARGREPGLRLERGGAEVPLVEWAAEILEQCRPIALALDAAHGQAKYASALAQAADAIGAPHRLSSARMLDAIERDFEQSYTRFIDAQSGSARRQLMQLAYPSELHERFESMARESVLAQQRIEAADTLGFETYLAQYLAPERLEL